MGKYTSLARRIEETKPQKKCVGKGIDNTYKHSIVVDTDSNPAPPLSRDGTNLRTTNLTNLTESTSSRGVAGVECIHGTTVEKCAVCSGYARWLAADEVRLRAAQGNPDALRREFWRSVLGGEA